MQYVVTKSCYMTEAIDDICWHISLVIDAEQRDSGTRQAEHKEKRREENEQNPLLQPEERRVKDALKQADQYGRDMEVSQTKPQTLLDDQDPFGASGATDRKESRPQVSLFKSDENST